VVGLAFAFSYVPQYSLLPLVLDEAAHGRYAPLASLARGANRSMDFQINRGMQWSVICSEDAPPTAPAEDPGALFGNEGQRLLRRLPGVAAPSGAGNRCRAAAQRRAGAAAVR
jgi:hypothetical protein